jgi:hypothetical protein
VDIIIMIILARYLGNQAEKKGEPANKWRWRVVLYFILFELTGIMISLMIVQNLYINAPFGLFCGLGGYLLAKSKLDQVPDKDKHWLDNIGEQ